MAAVGPPELPLMLTFSQARRFVGMGEHKFRRLVQAGVIPSWVDPDTGHRSYSRLVLEAWAANAATPEEGAA
jgi:hypothetical protein